jgi:hypothetical protein
MEDETEEEGVKTVDNNGECWKDKQGRFHRLRGPAIIYPNGDMAWYRHGQLHRDDGPAIVYVNGDESWYKHGKLHRDDGPARIWSSEGIEEWWKDDKPYKPSAHEIMAWKLKKQQTSNTTQTNDF